MRKHIRKLLRKEGESLGVKASRYVRREFDRRQVKRYGYECRRANQAKSTHKRSKWRLRTAAVL